MKVGDYMKILQVIKKIITSIFGVAFYAFAIVLTMMLLNYNDFGVTQIDNYSLIKVNTDVATEKYQKGDLVVVEYKKPHQLKAGDELFAYRLDSSKVLSIDFGVVGKVYETDNAVAFKNGATYDMNYVAGVPIKVFPRLGAFLMIAESKWGFLFLVLVPSFLIFIYSIYTLIVEIKYGKYDIYNYNGYNYNYN
jgi:hypothetical protein